MHIIDVYYVSFANIWKNFEQLFGQVYLFILICILSFLGFACLVYFLLKRHESEARALYEAVKKSDIQKSLALMKKCSSFINAPIGENGLTPFLLACSMGNESLVKLMLENGADLKSKSADNESGFFLACLFHIKHPEILDAGCIRILYYAHANIDETDNKGLTPLQLAALSGHKSLVKWLLKKGASVDVNPSPYLLLNSPTFRKSTIESNNINLF